MQTTREGTGRLRERPRSATWPVRAGGHTALLQDLPGAWVLAVSLLSLGLFPSLYNTLDKIPGCVYPRPSEQGQIRVSGTRAPCQQLQPR